MITVALCVALFGFGIAVVALFWDWLSELWSYGRGG